VERGEPDGPLTGAWDVVRWPGSSGRNISVERTRDRRVANGGGDECGEEGPTPHPFIGGWGGVEASGRGVD
jgi:hypothetical protein